MGYEVYEMLIREINLEFHSKILHKISSHNKEENRLRFICS